MAQSRHLAVAGLAVVCVAMLLAGLAWSQPNDRSKKVALLVGVNQYDKRGFAERPLLYAERDVEDLQKELTKAGFRVTLLTGSATGPQRATRANIDKALDAMLRGLNASDIVLVGLAGHGQQFDVQGKEDAFFCPVDAEKNASATMVSLTGLLERLDGKGGTNLVLVDACRDDPTRGGVRGIAGNELHGRLPANTAVLFSCAARQQALETDQAGGGHGVFFHFVLEGLRGKAKDQDGKVTWDDLVSYVRRHVNQRAQEWFPDRAKLRADGKLQTPHLLGSLVDVPVLVDLSRTATVDLGGGGPMEFRRISRGQFRMGSPSSERDRFDNEVLHTVEITRDFFLSTYAVTRGQFQAFVKDTGYKTEAEQGEGGEGFDPVLKKFRKGPEFTWRNPGFHQTDEHPVVLVSWTDAVQFCAWMRRKTGRAVRLPTEAEWEYACRAGSTSRFHFGDDEEKLAGHANVADASFRRTTGDKFGIAADDGFGFTAPVGKYRPNAWGLYDMHGNVWQWCQDWHGRYGDLGTKDPVRLTPIKDQEWRVLRGGAWYDFSGFCRSAYRIGRVPSHRDAGAGFRVAFRLD